MKILIIWYNKIDENGSLGGVEKYNLNLIKFFLKKNYEIDFLYFNDDIHNCINSKKINYIKIELSKKIFPKNKFFKFLLYLKLLVMGRLDEHSNQINNFIAKNKEKYFLIINNIPCFLKKNIRKLNNFIFIQHSDWKMFDKFFFYNQMDFQKKFLKKGTKNLIINTKNKLLFLVKNGCIFKNKNILKKTKKVVFFSNDINYLKLNKNALIGATPIELDYFKKKSNWYINNKNNNSILYFGRFDNNQKNLELLSKIAKKENINIDLYGHGEYETELKKNFLLNLKGQIKTVSEKIDILSKYDLFLLTSNYEGLPIAAIELLSMGVIGIIRNTFLEAKNLIPEKYHSMFLVSADANIDEYKKKINYIKTLTSDLKNIIRINLINHIKNNYHTKIFENNWNKILENIN